MGRVKWSKDSFPKAGMNLIPAPLEGSLKDFRPPPTLESDFKRLLRHDVKHVNYTYEQIRDWYEEHGKGYTPIYLRGQQIPIEWKSKIAGSDMSTSLKVSHDIPVRKGDMFVREDGIIYLANWATQVHPNNLETQIIECNKFQEVTRAVPDETDDQGHLITPAHKEIIAPSIPCSYGLYAGRPDYIASQAQPGINADHLITIQVQWNPVTKNIHINDEFIISRYTYRIIDISLTQVDISGTYGIIDINAKRVAGGVED